MRVLLCALTFIVGSLVLAHSALARAVASNSPQAMQQQGQMKTAYAMQMQQAMAKTQGDLNNKLGEKADLEKQLGQIQAVRPMAKTFKLNSKLTKMDKNEAEIKNKLQQLEVDIKSLKQKQASYEESLKNLNKKK